MKQFDGFPARMEFTPIPNLLFSGVLPGIADLAELKTTLHVFAVLYRKKGSPRFLTYGELLENADLMNSLKGGKESPEKVLDQALKLASKRGTLIHVVLDRGATADDIYFLNDEPGRRAVARIESGELKLGRATARGQAYIEAEELPDIFTLYEQNIGMLTPMIADELRLAMQQYPESWIRDAIKEAVKQGKRKWYKVSDVLERWSTEGRSDATYQRDSKKTDPDKYIKGKYGHMVQR